jgi:hypothetical protein
MPPPSRGGSCAIEGANSLSLQPKLLQQLRQVFAQLEPVAGGVCEEESALSTELGEPLVLDLEQPRPLPALEFSLLDVINGAPVERRQQAPPGLKVETHFDLVMAWSLTKQRTLSSLQFVVNEIRSSRSPATKFDHHGGSDTITTANVWIMAGSFPIAWQCF